MGRDDVQLSTGGSRAFVCDPSYWFGQKRGTCSDAKCLLKVEQISSAVSIGKGKWSPGCNFFFCFFFARILGSGRVVLGDCLVSCSLQAYVKWRSKRKNA